MNKRICSLLSVLLFAAFLALCSTYTPAAEMAVSITAVKVKLEGKDNLPYSGKFAADFPAGIPISPGSGLSFRGKAEDGSWLFWGVTDRGPGFGVPDSPEGVRQKVYLSPSFSPSIIGLRYVPGSSELTIDKSISLSWKEGKASGLPLPPPEGKKAEEIALDENFKALGHDPRGIDSEGISASPDGSFWICDEYRPSLLKADSSGTIVKCLEPSRGLPSFLAGRGRNRGFEGVAALPGGQVLAALQSPLSPGGKPEDFVRFVLHDEGTGVCKTLAYPLEPGLYKDLKAVRISDLAAVGEGHVLVLEHGPLAIGPRKRHTAIYLVEWGGASDIAAGHDEKQAEVLSLKTLEERGLKSLTKKKLCELPGLSELHESYAEGMTLVDERTLVVIDDSDFGAESCIITEDGRRIKGDHKAYTLSNGIISHGGTPSKDRFAIVPAIPHPTVLVLKFSSPLRK
ncbi:MAG: esterase-like activity of phytase family protein [Candidatus Eremiobacteraeota bacterium]|nr:esterase-like activity of phytase family protein [Candidatus Eremiobacteraeota bacterium]